MAEYALNRLDPANWQFRSVEQQDGSVQKGRVYVSPEPEQQKLARLASESRPGSADLDMTLAIGNAVDAVD